jgi:hypothetical protein
VYEISREESLVWEVNGGPWSDWNFGRDDGVFIGRMRNGELGMMQPLRLGKNAFFFPVLFM